MSNINESKEEFIRICKESIKRPGVDAVLRWLEKSDFYTAPASTRFHGSYAGGLLIHSLSVYKELKRLLVAFPEIQADDETVAIISLFHDLCKVNLYGVEKRNRKNEHGQWESYDAYTHDEKFKFGGHGAKSVFIVQSFMQLRPEEAVAIHCHMGAFDGNVQSIGSAFEAYPLAWLLHVADCAATYIDEKGEK